MSSSGTCTIPALGLWIFVEPPKTLAEYAFCYREFYRVPGGSIGGAEERHLMISYARPMKKPERRS
ncbi:MAG: hypothetical protein ABSA50_01075 [Candidatus Bathyarchaeia archaeon]